MNLTKRQRFLKRLKKDSALHLMMLVPVLMHFIFHYIPLAGIIIAFQKYNPGKGFIKSEFVGFDNFKTLFTTPGFINSLENTVIIAVGKIILSIVVPVTVALLLNEMKAIRVKRTIQTVVYLPHFISWVLMSGIIIEILNPTDGLINSILAMFGQEHIYFLGSNKYFRPVVWITDIWKDFGYATIVYMAALAGVDSNLYEAASLDGAGHMQKAWHITLPGIRSTIILMATLKLGSILNAGFDQIYNLYSAVTYETGDIIDTLVYRLGLGGGQFSLATAAGLFKGVISGSLLVLAHRIAYKVSGYHVF